MRCIVLWQSSLLAVLAIVITCWCCFVCADALPTARTKSDSHEATHSSLITTVSNSSDSNKVPTSTSANIEDSLEEQLRDDQAALNRMITILSLIGGLGGIAIIATVVIVTKTRRRNKREMNKGDVISAKDDKRVKPRRLQSTLMDQQRSSYSMDFIVDQPSATHHINECNNASHDHLISMESSTNSDSDSSNIQNSQTPQPSAPPTTLPFVPTMITSHQHRRVLSLPSQRQLREEQPTPIPSAPSAKELDSMRILRESGPTESSHQGQNESFYLSRPSLIIDDSTNSMTPDLPPPAYTPNPSPFYDESHQNANFNTTVAIRAQLTTLRRHSQT